MASAEASQLKRTFSGVVPPTLRRGKTQQELDAVEVAAGLASLRASASVRASIRPAGGRLVSVLPSPSSSSTPPRCLLAVSESGECSEWGEKLHVGRTRLKDLSLVSLQYQLSRDARRTLARKLPRMFARAKRASVFGWYEQSLRKMPFLAVLAEPPEDIDLDSFLGQMSFCMQKAEGIQLLHIGTTKYLGSDRVLCIIGPSEEAERMFEHLPPNAFLTQLAQKAQRNTKVFRPKSGPWYWALHDAKVARAIVFGDTVEQESRSSWWKLLEVVFPGPATEDIVRLHYGAEVAEVFTCLRFFIRGLWVAAAFYMVTEILKIIAPEQNWLWFYFSQMFSVLWACSMAASAGAEWTILLAQSDGEDTPTSAGTQEMGRHTSPPRLSQMFSAWTHDTSDTAAVASRHYEKNPDYRECKNFWAYHSLVVLVSLVSTGIFCVIALHVLVGFLEFKMWMVLEWGECLHTGCMGPDDKHGTVGMVADIGLDIALALFLVVLLGEACKAMGEWLAGLWNFKYMPHKKVMKALYAITTEALSKTGFFALMGFFLVPQWVDESVPLEVQAGNKTVAEACKGLPDYEFCSSIYDCESDSCCSGMLMCANVVAKQDVRITFFKQFVDVLLIVEPLVELIPSLLGPLIARWLDTVVKTYRCVRSHNQCAAGVARLLALIFVIEPGVTGLRFICNGETFTAFQDHSLGSSVDAEASKTCPEIKEISGCEDDDPEPESSTPVTPVGFTVSADADADDKSRTPNEALHAASEDKNGPLDQVQLREFDALDELKELKLNFLFLVMFAPFNRFGILTILGARIIQWHLKIRMLFLLTRRPIPSGPHAVTKAQGSFMTFIVVVSTSWHCICIFFIRRQKGYENSHFWLGWFCVTALALGFKWVMQRLILRYLRSKQEASLD